MIDYSVFEDIHKLSHLDFCKVQNDFCNRFRIFLHKELGIHPIAGSNIPNIVWESMTHESLHYHTPFHIMAIFEFCKKQNIKLSPCQELAIWFHDAIYYPGSTKNESDSAELMRILLLNCPCSDEKELIWKIHNASLFIKNTAKHFTNKPLEGEIEKASMVMDLDIASLSLSSKSFDSQNECIDLEFSSVFPVSDVNNGRIKFLESVLNQDRIYRTDFFLKNFEYNARKNIENEITKLKKRVECEG